MPDEYYKQQCLGEWPAPTPEETQALKIVCEYYRLTEAFDKLLASPGAEYHPQLTESSIYASAVRAALRDVFHLPEEFWRRAKQQILQWKTLGRELAHPWTQLTEEERRAVIAQIRHVQDQRKKWARRPGVGF